MGLNSTAVAIQPNVSCTCNCKRSLFQSMEISKYRPAALRGWACGAGRAALGVQMAAGGGSGAGEVAVAVAALRSPRTAAARRGRG